MSEDRPLISVVGAAPVDSQGRPDGGDPAAWPGGGPLRVAIGLGRLGVRVGLLTNVGRDAGRGADFGRGADVEGDADGERDAHGFDAESYAARLAANGVESVWPDSAVAGATRVRFEGSVRGYAFEFGRDDGDAGRWHVPADTACLHTGAIATAREPDADTVRRIVERWSGQATVSYDPDCRPSRTGDHDRIRARVERLVGLADVIKAADEDLRWLYPERDHIEMADAWLARGPALVVVTRGNQGAYGLCRSGAVTCLARPVDVVDTVGAGDAFTAGLLCGLAGRDLLGAKAADRLRALSTIVLGELLDEATVVAALTCGRAGAEPPTAAEVAGAALRGG
jgi:fructokinase